MVKKKKTFFLAPIKRTIYLNKYESFHFCLSNCVALSSRRNSILLFKTTIAVTLFTYLFTHGNLLYYYRTRTEYYGHLLIFLFFNSIRILFFLSYFIIVLIAEKGYVSESLFREVILFSTMNCTDLICEHLNAIRTYI